MCVVCYQVAVTDFVKMNVLQKQESILNYWYGHMLAAARLFVGGSAMI